MIFRSNKLLSQKAIEDMRKSDNYILVGESAAENNRKMIEKNIVKLGEYLIKNSEKIAANCDCKDSYLTVEANIFEDTIRLDYSLKDYEIN